MELQIGRSEYQERQLPMHTHKMYEITAYDRGYGAVYTAAGDFSVAAGGITIMPPGISHRAVSSDGLESIHISGDFRSVFHLEKPILVLDNAAGEGMQLVRMLYRNRYASNDYLAALCNALVHFLLQNLSAEDAVSLAVRNIVFAITENFHDSSLSLNELLNRSGYAEDYVRAQFRKITGQTPTAFLHDLRVKRACYLIEVYRRNLPLAEIAGQCGYTDYVLFSKKFKSIMGISPRRYQEEISAV